MSLQGTSLIAELRDTSGLDQDFFEQQMTQILQKYSVSPENLEIDQLREILADYLQALILEDEAQYSPKYA